MSAIRCDVEPVGTRLLVRIYGELSLTSAPRVRAGLMKCLVEQPDAVVVDLAGMVVTEPAAAAVFLAAADQASLWPGTPLLLSVPDPELFLILSTAYRRLAVHSCLEAALAAEPRQQTPSISDMLLPLSGAAHQARDLATEACLRWRLPHVTASACLITGELVTNAVVHAQTMVGLRLTRGRRYFMIAVRDGSTATPVLPSQVSADPAAPRGLLLVDAMAYRWGSLPAHDGKVVWATLPLRTSSG